MKSFDTQKSTVLVVKTFPNNNFFLLSRNLTPLSTPPKKSKRKKRGYSGFPDKLIIDANGLALDTVVNQVTGHIESDDKLYIYIYIYI